MGKALCLPLQVMDFGRMWYPTASATGHGLFGIERGIEHGKSIKKIQIFTGGRSLFFNLWPILCPSKYETSTLALVLIDISGYTKFITFDRRSLLHATEIISELLEGVINTTEFPLVLNKIEGDATLFYSDISVDPSRGAREVVRQVSGFFEVFDRRAANIADTRKSCSCDACHNVTNLQLKIILHAGEVAVRTIRQFEELSGESVILVHRLLKNSVPDHEYVLITETFKDLSAGMELEGGTAHEEVYPDLGAVKVHVFSPGQFPGTKAHHHHPASA